eukprot:9987630-Ditylum_brightwellii.AAC.1
MEADMSSVEHILYYSEEIEEDAPAEIPETDPKEGEWPTRGEIEISNASMRNCNGPLVLKNISLSLKGGEKVGVVGQRGSRKSSLMVVLFQISEIEAGGGNILIDGVDTAQGLWDILGEVQLAEVIDTLPDGLDELIAEGGENFLQGQCQLLCIT